MKFKKTGAEKTTITRDLLEPFKPIWICNSAWMLMQL